MSRRGPFAEAARRMLSHRLAVAGGATLAGLGIAVAVAPWISGALGVDPITVDLYDRFAPPSPAHWLGTDELGRDVLARLLYGGRVSLAVGLAAALASTVIGTAIGLLAGYHGGSLDAILMRLTDAIIALPLLPLLIVLGALDLGKLGIAPAGDVSLYRIIVIVALVGWTTVARLVRSQALALRRRPFVEAARAQGAGPVRIAMVHILPNLVSPVIVATTLAAGNVILLESVLSFLGLGIQPPTPSWGNLLTNAQELVWASPGLAIYPGLFILVVVIALNFLGDGLREALDPRGGGR